MDESRAGARLGQGWLIVGLVVAAALCSCGSAKDPVEPVPIEPEYQAMFDATSERLSGMLDRGFVVSRWSEGWRPEHQGDSLIWSGLAMAALSCDAGREIENAVLEMMDTLDGGLARHPDLMDKISLDGAIGVYRGAAERMVRCEGSKERWWPRLYKHLQRQTLNPSSNVTWPLEFRYVPELLLAVASDDALPDPSRLVALSASIEAWALATMASKSSCYRLNLGYQTLRTIEALGVEIPGERRDGFCAVTRGARIATIEAWCGRASILPWIEQFQYDSWEFAHQRCPGWESPDGKPGLHTPAIDLLEAIRQGYQLNP